ncbi:prolipoprotein diacylglyceryl transferase [Geomonas paludis]|uniref:Phosphatidylglycerol--prolipoprotein diacylglyceryl transferase n=1 Tax=Geomonas paludis TaxID=2740185 RepID=A0A6V8MY17_9BACT|nr:prolipoprotein diacylglyceryl transferase [Geomonas paludis]GFO64423.1 prolipoprotein diacylglyceryl transferase [Geomonas paludis]
MIFPNIDPVFLRLGPLEFRWYGLMYICGFVAAYFIILSGVKRKGLPLNRDQVADLIFTVAVGVILGGRLGYILFYNFDFYLAHPLKLFAVWEGGMSFHGGLIGALLASIYYVRKFKLGFYPLADLGFLAAPVGLGFGRIGNFINGELYGRVTDAPWGIVFPSGGPLPRHPSQLYEAFLEGPIMFLILYQVSKRVRCDGAVVWSFIALYGLFRFLVEFVRQPDEQLGFVVGGLSMGQMLSLPMFLLGVAMVRYRCRRG